MSDTIIAALILALVGVIPMLAACVRGYYGIQGSIKSVSSDISRLSIDVQTWNSEHRGLERRVDRLERRRERFMGKNVDDE